MNSTEQLLADLKENFQDFKCSVQDLKNPTEEFVINFYSFFLQEFEVDISNINQVQFSQASVVNAYQDAYSGIIPKINMLKCIRAFDIVKDFGMLDIVSPAPKRTQDLLRAFINFYIHADQRISNLIDKKTKLKDHQLRMTNLKNERDQLKENLNSLFKEQAHIQDTKAQLEKELLNLQQTLNDLRLEKKAYKEESEKNEKELNELDSILQKLNKEEAMINGEVQGFSNQVVTSPTVVLSEVELLRRRHDEISELRDQKRDMVESKMEASDLLEKMVEEQQKRVLLLDELLKLIDQLREYKQAVSGVDENTKASQEHLTDLKATLLAKSNRKQNCQEKLQSLYLKWKTLKPQLTENLESALRDLQDKKIEKNKIINLLNEDSSVQEKIELKFLQIKETIETVINDYRKLQIQENILFETCNRNLESSQSALEKEAAKQYQE